MKELKEVRGSIENLDSLSTMDQHKNLICISDEVTNLISKKPNSELMELGKTLLDRIHNFRYKLAYNKATDNGLLDIELKKAWKSLNTLVNKE